MADTKDINEVDLLFNLKNRLKQEKTFTNVGPTLIIVNPFKEIENVYGPEKIDYFIDKHEKENPEIREKITEPHLYDVVLLAIREILKKNCKNQALIISGESGAGKTVATKNSMQCITYYFTKLKENLERRESIIYSPTKTNIIIKEQTPLEKKILDCNPILEGFGNAKTVRNDNSSRFGKYVKIKINKTSNIIEGAEMYTYLLEKSRITELSPLERNYHIFYYFLKGAEDELLKEVYLTRDIKYYDYLWHDKTKKQVSDVPSIDDSNCYKEVIDCFKSTNFTDEEIKQIFKVIAAVLLIGNVTFKVENNQCTIENRDVYDNICKLLDLESEPLLSAITRKYMPSEKKYGGSFDANQIKSFFDGLAKELYNRLFLWIVKKLNKTLDVKEGEDNLKYIGLLDIFGFECFQREHNSIEQLCINYTNEQLQQLYIKDIFESDKEEFRRENLEDKLYLLDATYKDNKDVIKLIKLFFLKISDVTMEDKKIYDLVKQFDKFIKNDKLFQKVKENKFFVDKFVSPFFSVEHSAKTVQYTSKNMIDKNKDEMKVKVSECLLNSNSSIFRLIFTITLNEDEFIVEKYKILDENRVVSKNEKFLGLKFCKEMKQLKKELKQCDHHYVRCLKPNEEKKSTLFYSNFVFNQIQYLGILATIQVRKNGYPTRRTYEDFYENYKLILNKFVDKNISDYQTLCKEIIIYLLGEEEANNLQDQYLFGKTKIFMKQPFNQKLELKKVELMKQKIYSLSIIKAAIIHLKKRQKHKRISDSIKNIKNYLMANKYKIQIKNKKDKIKRIQSMYFTHIEKQKIMYLNEVYFKIQNSLRIINAKKHIENIRKLNTMTTLNLQMYYINIKKNNLIITKKVLDQIIEEAKEKYAYRQYNKVWNKINPYILKILAAKRFKKIKKEAQIIVMKKKYISTFKIIQLNLFLHKIDLKKQKVHYIYKFASTQIASKKYKNIIKNIKIIQHYMTIYINKTKIYDKINNDYFRDDNSDNNEIQNNENEEEAVSTIFSPSIGNNNNNLNNNKDNNNRKLLLTDFEKYKYNNKYGGGLNETRFTTIGNNNDSKTIPFITNNLATLNTIESEKLTPTRNKKKERYIDAFNSFDDINNKEKAKSTKNTNLKKRDNIQNCNEILPIHYNFNQPIVGVFAKILDIDCMYNYEDIDDNSWNEEFYKIYKECLQNEAPIQKIEISNCHTMVINSKGKVYSWGWNNFGQCGIFPHLTKKSYVLPNLSRKKNEKYPNLPILNYKNSDNSLPIQNISNISLNDDFSIIITQKGNAILFGDNSYGQLGQGHRMEVKSAQILTRFKNKIKSLYTTGNMNLLLTKKNDLYLWYICENDNLIQPSLIYFQRKINIESISTGKNFAILLSSNGICYGVGSNEKGELGMIEDITFCEIPQEITNLTQFNERIIQVRCGFKHSICLSVTGKTYTWGNNTFGQLGHINNGNNLPCLINIEDKYERIKIIQIAAGFRSSFYMTNKGSIYYTGVINNESKTMTPKKFELTNKYNEIDESDFFPVKIWTTYSRNKTIFYASLADIRNLKSRFYNIEKIRNITLTLAEKWIDDEITAPFIPHISKYFQSCFMRIEQKQK